MQSNAETQTAGRGLLTSAAEGALEFDTSVQSTVGTVERCKEPVTLEPDDLAIVRTDNPPDEQMVIFDQLLPALGPELRCHHPGVGYVAEHQGQRPVGRTQPADIRRHRL